MRRIQRAALVVALAALSGGAFAQGYAGVSAGQSKVDLGCSGTLSCDQSDNAYKVFGGYMVDSDFGVEAVYYNQGRAGQTAFDTQLGNVSAEWKGDGLGVYGVAVASFGRGVSVFGKIGLVSARIRFDAKSSSGSASDSERHTHVGWGVGVGYDVLKNVGLRLELEQVHVEVRGDKKDANLITLGALYRF